MGNEPWQNRLKRAGYSQKDFAELIGMSQNAITAQLSGKVEGNPSRYIKFIIMALEKLSTEQKEALEAAIKDES
ncbi:helix-turn-helix domain-containing protein [Neorhizobium lilium]|nr:helix-turn-helix transcriptional regulator [Neorhizobium lilium]